MPSSMTNSSLCVFIVVKTEIWLKKITGKEIKAAKCTKKEGNPPKQTVDFEEMALTNSSMDLDENFYGDQDFDIDEFDPEGFEGLNGDTAGGSFEEDRL